MPAAITTTATSLRFDFGDEPQLEFSSLVAPKNRLLISRSLDGNYIQVAIFMMTDLYFSADGNSITVPTIEVGELNGVHYDNNDLLYNAIKTLL